MTDDTPLLMPFRNVKYRGDLTPQESEWWEVYKRAIDQVREQWDRERRQRVTR